MAINVTSEANSYIRTTNLPGMNDVTLLVWWYPTTTVSWACPISLDLDTNDNLYVERSSTGTQFHFEKKTSSGGYFSNAGGTIVNNAWNLVALVSGATSLIGYCGGPDGALTVVNVGTTSGSFTPANLRVGDSPWSDEYAGGRIACVKIWSAQLSQAEIELERRQYLPVRFANLHAFYPLLGLDSASAVVDYSGNGFNLTAGTASFVDGPPIPWKRGRSSRIFLPAAGGGSVLTLQVSESLVLSDTPIKQPGKTLTESVTLSEALAKAFTQGALVEAISLADVLARETRLAKVESVALADALVRGVQISKVEVLNTVDSLARQFIQGALVESLGLSDNLSAALVLVLQLAESLTLSDAKALESKLAKIEGLSLSESLAKTVSPAAFLESLELSDNLGASLLLILQLAESLNLSDAGTRSLLKSLVESLSLADSAVKQAQLFKGESMSLGDVLEAVRQLNLSVSESLTLGDSMISNILAIAAAVNVWRARMRETAWRGQPRDVIWQGKARENTWRKQS